MTAVFEPDRRRLHRLAPDGRLALYRGGSLMGGLGRLYVQAGGEPRASRVARSCLLFWGIGACWPCSP